MKNGRSPLPPVSDGRGRGRRERIDVGVLAAPSSSTRSVVPDGLENCSRAVELGVELGHDRRQAAGEIDADHLVVRDRPSRCRQRQRRRIVDPHDA